MSNYEPCKKKWKIEDNLLIHNLVYEHKPEVGFSNIKIYGRENKNAATDKTEDKVILYLCGHRQGYDHTRTIGFMLVKEKFIEIAVYIIRNHQQSIFKPIKLRDRDVKTIIKILSSLQESDLIGDQENKVEILQKWIKEFERILRNHGKDIAVFLELYE